VTEPAQAGYILGHSDDELARLARQGAVLADLTEDVLRRAGLAPGMRVLDLGSGVGDVALLAGRLVGPTGAVLGIDRSAEALDKARRRAKAAGQAWVRFAVTDVAGFSPDEPFDALIGRLVLLYVPDPSATLRALVRHVRPGGIVAFQEMDMTAARAVPDAPLYRRCGELIVQAFARSGFDPDTGSRLHRIFRGAGLPAPQMIGAARIEAGPDTPAFEYLAQTVRSLLPVIERLRLATAAEIDIDTLADRLRQESLRGDHCHTLPLMVGAWCRLPA
jgi:ubiquinone/menaquinone biosynthesis C-methylase UbiE